VLSLITDASKRNEDKNDRECSPSITNAWEGWEHNGWGVLSIIEMLKEVEIQWMGSTPHHTIHISSEKLLC
jgi:hypothetical protein